MASLPYEFINLYYTQRRVMRRWVEHVERTCSWSTSAATTRTSAQSRRRNEGTHMDHLPSHQKIQDYRGLSNRRHEPALAPGLMVDAGRSRHRVIWRVFPSCKKQYNILLKLIRRFILRIFSTCSIFRVQPLSCRFVDHPRPGIVKHQRVQHYKHMYRK